MRRLKTMSLAVCLATALGGASAQDGEATPRFTADAVFNLEYGSDPQISPDGERLVYVRRSMDKSLDRVIGSLWTVDLASGAHQPLVTGMGSVSRPRWSPNGDRLLYSASGENGSELRVLFMDTGRSHALAQFETAPREATWSPNGRMIAFTQFVPAKPPSFAERPSAPKGAKWPEPVKVYDDLVFRFDGAGYLPEGASHIFVVPADGGSPRQLTFGENDFGSPDWASNDALLIVGNDVPDAELDPIESEIYRVELSSGARTVLTSRDGPDGNPITSPDGALIAYLGYDDEVRAYQQTNLYIMNPDGTNSRELAADFDRSFDAIAWTADSRSLIGQVEMDGDLALVSVPLNGGMPDVILSDMGGTSIGRPYAAGNFSVGETIARRRSTPAIAYTQASQDRPAEIAIKQGTAAPRTLTQLNEDALAHLDLAAIEEISVPSSVDGLPIEAWVALPPDFEANGSFPMIMEIHGGPFAMYGPYFSAEIQRYAAEGYVTVYVNPRGSTGYGDAFAQYIDLAYPGDDYHDLISVVEHLIDQSYVDASRLYVTGGSGGGVLTAWIVGNTDMFRAAATIKPVINWTTMALTGDIARFVSRHWLRAQPWENQERYWSLSPISKVGNVTTPTLVMVGEEDWRTPTWEAEQFYTALKVQGIDTALIRIPGASHSIAARPSRLIAKVDNIMGWFATYDSAEEEAAPEGE
ncbi:MAG: S9 family peptidase [Pseudomonadota bacterium]